MIFSTSRDSASNANSKFDAYVREEKKRRYRAGKQNETTLRGGWYVRGRRVNAARYNIKYLLFFFFVGVCVCVLFRLFV